MRGVLFVCLGNICRSPLAEAAFRKAAAEAGIAVEADSAGTGEWHVGDPPDARAQAVALRNGIDISHYRARQVERADFLRFERIVALDPLNLRDLKRVQPAASTARLSLLLDLVPGREGEGVHDPYYGDDSGFEVAWADAVAGAEALVRLFARAA